MGRSGDHAVHVRITARGLLWPVLIAGCAGCAIFGPGGTPDSTLDVLSAVMILTAGTGLLRELLRRLRRGASPVPAPALTWAAVLHAPPRSVLWAATVASPIAIGIFQPHPGLRLGADAAVMVMIGCPVALAVSAIRRRQQRKWRESGGRMTPTAPARAEPTMAEMAARIDRAGERLGHAEARLDDYDRAWSAIGNAGQPQERARHLHAVDDTGA